MLDTVKGKIWGGWLTGCPVGWMAEERHGLSIDENGERERDCVFMVHKETGLRVSGDSSGCSFFECSLPRQIYEHNGILLDSSEAVAKAWEAARGRIAEVVSLEGVGGLTRLDGAWQFRGNAAAIVMGLGASRHPQVHKEPELFFSQSVSWRGKEVVGRCYDKSLEVFHVPGDVVRMETQWRGKALEKALGRVDLEAFDLVRCWNAYRQFWSRLPAFTLPKEGRAPRVAEWLSYLDSCKNWKGAQAPSWIYMQAMGERGRKELRKKMAAVKTQRWNDVRLADWMPVGRLPEVVNLQAVA